MSLVDIEALKTITELIGVNLCCPLLRHSVSLLKPSRPSCLSSRLLRFALSVARPKVETSVESRASRAFIPLSAIPRPRQSIFSC
jgi:hypothetical protein